MVVPLLRAHPVECKPLPLNWAPPCLSACFILVSGCFFHFTVILIFRSIKPWRVELDSMESSSYYCAPPPHLLCLLVRHLQDTPG